jgi:hypothetical protein
MTYIVSYKTINEYTDGMTVCFDDISDNPNSVGILHKISSDDKQGRGYWKSVINGVEYVFNVKGVSIEPVQGIQLYTPISNVKQQISRAVESKMLLASTSTADSLQVKDYFALFAMHAILSEMQDPLSINDGTIASIAAKAYKIADSMILQSKESSDSNNNSENDIETSTE